MMNQIQWNDPSAPISKHFTVREALWLPTWGRLANDSDGLNDSVKAQLVKIAASMDVVRDFLGLPISVKCWYRPQAYNLDPRINGAQHSAHMCLGDWAAVDFWCDADGDGDKDGADCDILKARLMPKLSEWGLRMENNGKGATWIHLDNKPVGPSGRFFTP